MDYGLCIVEYFQYLDITTTSYSHFSSDDVSADEDVVFIPDTSMSFDQNEGNALGSTFEKKDINSAETSDSEGVVVSSGSALASFKLTVRSTLHWQKHFI